MNLRLTFNNIGENGAKYLSNGIEKLINITDLNIILNFNIIGNKGAKFLSNSIKKLINLKCLIFNVI